ncbi:MAG TPA: MBL fold metallo-hydrolase [Steroidobacteraceae bacterium]|nr:MBL fold metallo-hydrolase [Steroidobacteraceae bacterium]
MNGPREATSTPAQAAAERSPITDYGDGISAVDTEHLRPQLDASHLIVHGGRAAFVDTGTALAVPLLLDALRHKGVAPEAVDWVFLTHIHLDHAGGAGALLRHLPNARAVVHPRGAVHLVDPAKLIAGTKRVYGEDTYARLYGEIVPVAAERIVVTDDGSRLSLAGRTFEFLHTPGHALHHYVIVDRESGGVFAGDTFGVSYRDLDVAGREFVMPATTPPHFDPQQLHASTDRILAVRPRAVYLTHYGRVTDLARLGRDLHVGIDAFVELARRHERDPQRAARMTEDMFRWLSAALDAHGFDPDPARRHRLLDPDVDLDVQGLDVWLTRCAA